MTVGTTGCGNSGGNGPADACTEGDCLDVRDQGPGDSGTDTSTPADTVVDHGRDLGPIDDVLDWCQESPKPFGCPCDENRECISGFCIAMDDGSRVCTTTCIEECAPGFVCRQIQWAGEPLFICLKIIEPLCRLACSADAACGSVAGTLCARMENSQFCLRPCASAEDCLVLDDDGIPVFSEGFFDCVETPNFDGTTAAMQCAPVSGHCLCGPEIDYLTDPKHCGGCEKDCNITVDIDGNKINLHATWSCDEGKCKATGCEGNWVNLNLLDEDGCEYECEFKSTVDFPDPDYEDANCDGIDGDAAKGVFVDLKTGDDDNFLGGITHPFKTITAAITFAASKNPKRQIYVSQGQYEEQVRVIDGVHIYGGYNAEQGWQRDIERYRTTIYWKGTENGAIRALVASGIQSNTVVQGFWIRSGSGTQPGESAYGVHLFQSGPGLVLEYNNIQAGNGMDGRNGRFGTNGNNGNNGGAGANSFEYGGWACPGLICACNCVDSSCKWSLDLVQGTAGGGGTSPCGENGGSGGRGGPHEKPGYPGSDAANNGGKGGPGAPQEKLNGSPGGTGSNGLKGNDGLGGRLVNNTNLAGFWLAPSGGQGENGQNGKGGGGGGGGGGDEGDFLGIRCDSTGGAGGGGGGGGCAGTGGEPGTGGGGSFGVFLLEASPTIRNNEIQSGYGGNGGIGGHGGTGGQGGQAGPGGQQADDNGGLGGAGGKGGIGGDGGSGGGGAGGPSFAIYVLGASSNPNCAANELLSYSGGTGGDGGANNRGQDGPSGSIYGPTTGCQ
jgi:hypothetical protein